MKILDTEITCYENGKRVRRTYHPGSISLALLKASDSHLSEPRVLAEEEPKPEIPPHTRILDQQARAELAPLLPFPPALVNLVCEYVGARPVPNLVRALCESLRAL